MNEHTDEPRNANPYWLLLLLLLALLLLNLVFSLQNCSWINFFLKAFPNPKQTPQLMPHSMARVLESSHVNIFVHDLLSLFPLPQTMNTFFKVWIKLINHEPLLQSLITINLCKVCYCVIYSYSTRHN